jgi:tRNA (cytidine32/guanosine34-2'-O)-methyltransferase
LSPTAVHRHLPGNFTREERHHAEESEVPLHAGDILDPVPDDESLAIRSSENPGRWRLIGELGEGAFASVWSAESKEHADEGVVAVKLVGRTMAARSRRTAISFYREVEVLRHLVHPGVVGYIAHFSTATHHALVLERLAGGELFSLLAEQANSDRMIRRSATDSDGYGFIRRVFGELSRAVAWLHEVEVVHRDIKLESESHPCLAYQTLEVKS